MQVYYTILQVVYIAFAVVIAALIGWNVFKSKKITDKVIGAIALIMFILRILLIKERGGGVYEKNTRKEST